MANSFDHIKFQVCWYKKDVISYDDFIEWATGVYPIYAKPLMQRHGLVKWTSVSVDVPYLFPKHGCFLQILTNELSFVIYSADSKFRAL